MASSSGCGACQTGSHTGNIPASDPDRWHARTTILARKAPNSNTFRRAQGVWKAPT
jgi:hypothetical protein